MKKTLIALALAALPVASMAEVVLYGNIKGGVEVHKVKNVSGTITNLVDYGSSIGFRGEEQLNSGLKAIWQVEQGLDIAGGAYGGTKARGFGTQDTFVGLAGSFGTIKAGYQSTPVKELNGKLDVWSYDDAGFATQGTTFMPSAAGLDMFTRGTDAVARKVAVSYETPNMAGFSAKVYVSPSDNNTAKFDEDLKTIDSATYGASLSYGQSEGFFADLAGVYVRNGEVKTTLGYNNKNAYQGLAQLGYKAPSWMLGVGYQYTHDTATAPVTREAIRRSQEVALTGTVNVTNELRLKASGAYGFGFETRAQDGTDKVKLYGDGKYYQGIVGADYALSKRTMINGQVGYVKIGKDTEDFTALSYGSMSVGLSHKF